MAIKHNIRQTDVMIYLTNKFNDNYYGIPFSNGFYKFYNNGVEVTGLDVFWYKPNLNDKGLFDISESFDYETLATTKKRNVTMMVSVNPGDYAALPNIEFASYTADIEFLVNADDHLVLQATKESLEEVRNNLIGNEEIFSVFNRNEDSIDEKKLKVATHANGLDYGSIVTIKGRNFMLMSMQVEVSVGYNVEFGNQVKWEVSKYTDNIEGESTEVIPVLASFGANNDVEPMQFLNGFTVEEQKRARQIHNYIKSRGFALTMTFFVDFSNDIIRDFYKQSFIEPEQPQEYHIYTEHIEYVDGEETRPDDLKFDNRYVYTDASVESITYGDILFISIGFNVSAKK